MLYIQFQVFGYVFKNKFKIKVRFRKVRKILVKSQEILSRKSRKFETQRVSLAQRQNDMVRHFSTDCHFCTVFFFFCIYSERL